jgi:hypothetical protein
MKCNLPKPEKTEGNLQMNLYDINKQIISQLSSYSSEELVKAADETLRDYKNDHPQKYYMLLCNELKYYTLFAIEKGSEYKFENEVILCLQDFADEIKVIDRTEDQEAVEIWIVKDNETYVMYLFGYEKGVIVCE